MVVVEIITAFLGFVIFIYLFLFLAFLHRQFLFITFVVFVGQVVHTYVPLSPSSVFSLPLQTVPTWYRSVEGR